MLGLEERGDEALGLSVSFRIRFTFSCCLRGLRLSPFVAVLFAMLGYEALVSALELDV